MAFADWFNANTAAIQAVSTVLLLMVTAYYARHSALLEQRHSRADERERRALAVSLLKDLQTLVMGEQHIRAMRAQNANPEPRSATGGSWLGKTEALLEASLKIDAQLADIATKLHEYSRAFPGIERTPSPDGLPELEAMLQRCRDLVYGKARPI